MADTPDLQDLLDTCDDDVRTEFDTPVEVIDVGHDLDVSDLYIVARRWHKVTDMVAVVADLKNSTQLGTGKHDTSTGRIYQAATGNVVRIFDTFDVDFLQIQGDGVFGLFWGDRRYERAICAGITIKTFSLSLVERLEQKWPDLTDVTGYKVGVASNRALVKNVGTPRNPAQQEPIWAGKTVNYATKAAQCADRHEMIVTGSVWDRVEKNDYLAFSCPCGDGPSTGIWADYTIDRLPDGDPERIGRVLSAAWCDTHGSDYCDAVMSGKKHRDDTQMLRKSFDQAHLRNAMWMKAKREREARRARIRGLAS